jgi:hypothetical protein
MTKKEFEIFKELVGEVELFLEAEGGCDHSVGICCCQTYQLLENAREIILRKNARDVKKGLTRVK